MRTADKLQGVSVQDYLDGEEHGKVRHEYLGGVVYAMAGASDEHNGICLNIATALHGHLRGKACRVFMADVRLRLGIAGDDLLYYPDLMVACDPRDTDRLFKQFLRVLIEVLSEATERTDRQEKFLGDTQIETLGEYVLVAQDRMEATVFRRASGWRPEMVTVAEAVLWLEAIGFSLSLAAVYEGILPAR